LFCIISTLTGCIAINIFIFSKHKWRSVGLILTVVHADVYDMAQLG